MLKNANFKEVVLSLGSNLESNLSNELMLEHNLTKTKVSPKETIKLATKIIKSLNYSLCLEELNASNSVSEQQELTERINFVSSKIYDTKPMGPQNQADYANSVISFNTVAKPLDLYTALQVVEKKFDRVKRNHWGARTCDIDILFYSTYRIQTEFLQIPHYGILNRDFVLEPMLAIHPKFQYLPENIPLNGKLASLTENYILSQN